METEFILFGRDFSGEAKTDIRFSALYDLLQSRITKVKSLRRKYRQFNQLDVSELMNTYNWIKDANAKLSKIVNTKAYYRFYHLNNDLSRKICLILLSGEECDGIAIRKVDNKYDIRSIDAIDVYKSNKEAFDITDKKQNSKEPTPIKKEETVKKDRRLKITKEIVIAVKQDLDAKVKYADIAANRKISISTIARIKSGQYDHLLDEPETAQITVKEQHQEEPTPIKKEETVKKDGTREKIQNVINKPKPVLECGLVKGRHNSIPTDLFVFNKSLSEELMFDYDKLDRICTEFIHNHIDFSSGEPDKSIILYATGIQCAISSFIKICQELHISLTIAHYNFSSGEYFEQEIFNYEEDAYTKILGNIFSEYNEVYLYDCKLDVVLNENHNIYFVTTEYRKNGEKYTEATISDDIYKAYEFYSSEVKRAIYADKDILVSIDEAKKENTAYKIIKRHVTTFNY